MKDNAYFDNAATTWPKPEPVYRFMDSFFRSHGVNPGRSGSLLAAEAEQMITATRSMLAGFFGFSGSASRVIFTQNGTDSLNQSVAGLVVPGDHIVTTRLEHNAVLRIANHLERDDQLQVTRVAPDADGYIDPQAIQCALQSNTRAIVLNHASNVIGTIQPLEEIARIATAAGVELIVDAAQTAGVVPIDMDELGISVLTFPGHKGLFGPMGIGGMIVSESVELRAQRFGGTGVDSLSTFQPDVYPHHLEAGTVNLPGIAGLYAAQLWFRALGERLQAGETVQPGEGGCVDPLSVDVSKGLKTHGELCRLAMHHIHQCELTNLQRIESLLRQYEAVNILANARWDARVATLSFTVDGLPIERVADQLDADHQICARVGLQCAPLVHVDANTANEGGTLRLSPGYFTDEEDMQQLLEALSNILA